MSTLRWAQEQAAEAICLFEEGEQATRQAQADHDAAVAQADAQNQANAAARNPMVVTVAAFQDPGEDKRQAARELLTRARQQLTDSGGRAAMIIRNHAEAAPEEPSWGEQALDAVGDVAGEVGTFAEEFVGGVWDSAVGTVEFLYSVSPHHLITDPSGYAETLGTVAQGVSHAVQNPVEFAKSMVSWDTWADNPGRALGSTVFGLIPGVGAAGKLGKLGKLRRLGKPREKGCFVAGTLVLTDSGQRRIEDIRVGDFVLATDPKAGTQQQRRVRATMVRTVFRLVDLTIAGHRVSCSPEHPFWVADQGWVKAGDLTAGAAVLDAESREHRIEATSSRSGTHTVHNLEVEELHTYHVSGLSVLVHNKPMEVPKPEGVPKKRDEKWLKKNGIDPHDVKDFLPGPASRFDLYVDKNGNMFAVRKGHDPRTGEYVGNIDDY